MDGTQNAAAQASLARRLHPGRAPSPPTMRHPSSPSHDMPNFEDLAERVERLLLRHEELRRTHSLLEQQCVAITQERDNLRSRLNAARSRIDTLLARLPTEPAAANPVENPLRTEDL